MKHKNISVIVIILLALTMSSCKKYEEGPRVSWYSKKERVGGIWVFKKVEFNDIDSSENYTNKSYEFTKDGLFTYIIDDNSSELGMFIIPGTWSFKEDKEKIQMKFYDFEFQNDYEYLWDIQRLTYYDMWLERKDSLNNTIRWELFKVS